MGDDLELINEAEKKIIEAVGKASSILEHIESGDKDAAKQACEVLVQDLSESQSTLLEIADRQKTVIPFLSSTIEEMLLAKAEQR